MINAKELDDLFVRIRNYGKNMALTSHEQEILSFVDDLCDFCREMAREINVLKHGITD